MPVFDFIRNSDGAKGSKRLVEVNVASIHPNPYQPRATFDEESIAELAQSIQQVGLLQPLLVRKVDDGSSAMMALIENLQREDLHYLEEAQCYQKLLETYGLTQEELANRLGKSQSSIANKLRLLKLSDEVKAAMTEKRLSERHARALLKLTDDKQRLDAVERIAEKGLSVKETEQMVEKTLNKAYDEKQDGAKPRPKLMRIVRDYRLFMNTINQAVNQLRESGMTVEVEQSDRADGVDIKISVTRK